MGRQTIKIDYVDGNPVPANDFNNIGKNLNYILDEDTVFLGGKRFVNIGINTAPTSEQLAIKGSIYINHSGRALRFQEGAVNTQNYMDFLASNNVSLGWFGKYGASDNSIHLESAAATLKINLTNGKDIDLGGKLNALTGQFTNIGINTAPTSEQLALKGSIYIDHSGRALRFHEGAVNTQNYMDFLAFNNVPLGWFGKYVGGSNSLYLDSAVAPLMINTINGQDIVLGGIINPTTPTIIGQDLDVTGEINPLSTTTIGQDLDVTENINALSDLNMTGEINPTTTPTDSQTGVGIAGSGTDLIELPKGIYSGVLTCSLLGGGGLTTAYLEQYIDTSSIGGAWRNVRTISNAIASTTVESEIVSVKSSGQSSGVGAVRVRIVSSGAGGSATYEYAKF